MYIKPIKKQKRIYEVIIDQIKGAIESGQIKPGDKLPSERELSKAFNVSRTSVKEAITVLEAAGVIEVRPGVGMFLKLEPPKNLLSNILQVINDNTPNFLDLLELRQAIEGDAAFYAASRITLEQRVKLTAIFKNLVRAEENGEAAIQEDYQFHYTIVESANNPVMLKVMNLIADQMIDSLNMSRDSSARNINLNLEVQAEHRKIYEAIMNRDPEQARQAAWDHLQGIKQRHRLLEKNSGEY